MRTRVGTLVAALLLLAACGGDPDTDASDPASQSSATSPTQTGQTAPTAPTAPTGTTSTSPTEEAPKETESASTAAPDGTTIVVEQSEFGPMLFDDTGQAIYLFDVETTSEPECYGECAVAWPPVFTDGAPVAGQGVQGSLLGTVERTDGRLQVTYNDHPLYFYAHEGKHEVLCHDVFLNGGNWYVVEPGGDAAPPG